jgi:hypothetical protein
VLHRWRHSLGSGNDVRRRFERPAGNAGELFAGERPDFHLGAAGLFEKGRVCHGRDESRADDVGAVGRRAGRHEERPSHCSHQAEILENLAVLVVAG